MLAIVHTLLLLLAMTVSSPAHEVTLSWALNPQNPKPPIVHTRVYKSQSPCKTFWLAVSGLNGTSWSDEGVLAGKTYCYFTTVRNPTTGKESGKSNEVTVTIP